jgi:uncharacterized protein
MLKQTIAIKSIPAIIWGNSSDSGYIYVHGKDSQKEDAEGFAKIAASKGYQVISFDLPEHGARKAEGARLTIQNAVQDLRIISDFVTGKWRNVSLFGSSLGTYFSLVAYRELKFNKCLFQSPILDMENLIQKMMKAFNISEDTLRERQEMATPVGETLSWSYYDYVRENPIVKWDNPTYILYGSNDHLTPRNIVDTFVVNFHCNLDVIQNGEHAFQTKEQKEVFEKWLNLNM